MMTGGLSPKPELSKILLIQQKQLLKAPFESGIFPLLFS